MPTPVASPGRLLRDGGGDHLEGARVTGLGRLLALSLAAFGAFGLWAGCSTVLLADLSRALDLSPGPLGVSLFAGAAASMVAMGSLGWTADRFGRRPGVAVFFGAMALGRFGTGWAVTRLGNRKVLLGAGILASCGMTLALATTLPVLIICGFLLVGLAISGMAPLAQSAAGGLFPKRAGAAVSVVITFGSGGGLLAAPLVGGVAELTGLRVALGLVVVAGFTISVLSLRLRGGDAGRAG